MEEKSPPADPACLLPRFSPEEVHKNIMRCFRLRNRVDLKLLGWIKILLENNHFKYLNADTAVQYIQVNLKYGQTEAYNVLKVAATLPRLPRTSAEFEEGGISWSQFKAIADIAKPSTEERWISYAKAHTVRALEAEVKDALEEGRELPNEEGRGLPNIKLNMIFRLTREKHEVVRKAMEKAAAALRASRGKKGERVSPEEVLLFISQLILEKELLSPEPKGSERDRSIYDILYQVCPACRWSCIHTEDGPVRVPYDHVEEIEGKARKVEIAQEELVRGEALPRGKINDLDVPKDVEVKVLARYGHSCARCGKKLRIHLHHIIFRSCGGPNEIWNLVPLCAGCHGLVHERTLEVFLDCAGDLHWRSRADRIDLVLKEEFQELSSLPPAVIVVEKEEASRDRGAPATPRTEVQGEPAPQAQAQGQVEAKAEAEAAQPSPSNGTAPVKSTRESEAAVEVLESIGYGRKEGRKLVRKALEMLSGIGREPTGDEIFNTALKGRPVMKEEIFRTSGKSRPELSEAGEARRQAPGAAPEIREDRETDNSS